MKSYIDYNQKKYNSSPTPRPPQIAPEYAYIGGPE